MIPLTVNDPQNWPQMISIVDRKWSREENQNGSESRYMINMWKVLNWINFVSQINAKIKKKKESTSLLDFSFERIFGERDIFFKFEAFRFTILAHIEKANYFGQPSLESFLEKLLEAEERVQERELHMMFLRRN